MAQGATSIDIKDILIAGGFGYTFGTNLFVSKMPDKPNDCIAIYDRAGVEPYQLFTYNRAVQIIVRNEDYQAGWTIAKQIMTILHDIVNRTVNSTKYIIIKASSDILSLGYDESKDRVQFSINFDIELSQ